MMVITPKHVGAVLKYILNLFLRQFNCASVGKQTNKQTNFYSIKIRGIYVKIIIKIAFQKYGFRVFLN
jgi:hypothetical protein